MLWITTVVKQGYLRYTNTTLTKQMGSNTLKRQEIALMYDKLVAMVKKVMASMAQMSNFTTAQC